MMFEDLREIFENTIMLSVFVAKEKRQIIGNTNVQYMSLNIIVFLSIIRVLIIKECLFKKQTGLVTLQNSSFSQVIILVSLSFLED